MNKPNPPRSHLHIYNIYIIQLNFLAIASGALIQAKRLELKNKRRGDQGEAAVEQTASTTASGATPATTGTEEEANQREKKKSK